MDELLVQKDGGLSQFRVYRARWLMLLLFSLGNFTNAAVWITFAPIQELVSSYYDVGATGALRGSRGGTCTAKHDGGVLQLLMC